MMWKHPRDVSAENLKTLAAAHSQTTKSAQPPSSRSGRATETNGAYGKTRGYIRDYYEFALEDGGVYRVYRDITTEQWFIDGIYD